jgi:ornithine carbamoyltransferase
MNHFQNKSFLKEIDFSAVELNYLVDFAAHLKYLKHHNIPHPLFTGQKYRPAVRKNVDADPVIIYGCLN